MRAGNLPGISCLRAHHQVRERPRRRRWRRWRRRWKRRKTVETVETVEEVEEEEVKLWKPAEAECRHGNPMLKL